MCFVYLHSCRFAHDLEDRYLFSLAVQQTKCMLSSLANLATTESMIVQLPKTTPQSTTTFSQPCQRYLIGCGVFGGLSPVSIFRSAFLGCSTKTPQDFFFFVFCVIILCTSNFASIKNGRVEKISVSAKNFSSAPAQ